MLKANTLPSFVVGKCGRGDDGCGGAAAPLPAAPLPREPWEACLSPATSSLAMPLPLLNEGGLVPSGALVAGAKSMAPTLARVSGVDASPPAYGRRSL